MSSESNLFLRDYPAVLNVILTHLEHAPLSRAYFHLLECICFGYRDFIQGFRQFLVMNGEQLVYKPIPEQIYRVHLKRCLLKDTIFRLTLFTSRRFELHSHPSTFTLFTLSLITLSISILRGSRAVLADEQVHEETIQRTYLVYARKSDRKYLLNLIHEAIDPEYS